MARLRPAAVAGTFYPAHPQTLRDQIAAFLDAAERPALLGTLRGLVVPHAGTVYSGPIAGTAYAQLQDHPAEWTRVLLLGPAHHLPIAGLGLPSSDLLDCPLGPLQVDDRGRHRALQLPGVSLADRAHAPEHSLELQFPFLRLLLPHTPVLPLLVGRARPQQVSTVLEALWDESTLLLISTDLSHFLPQASAREQDQATARAIVELAPENIGHDDACGRLPLQGMLSVARSRGYLVDRLDLRTSGDTAGGPDRVVGYGAFRIVEPGG